MLEPHLLGRFTTHLKEALHKALLFAIQHGRDLVEPGDLVVGLLREQGSLGSEILRKANITVEAAERAFQGTPVAREPGSAIAPDLSSGVKRALEKSVLTAHQFEHKYIGTEHLLSALLELALPDVQAFFAEQGMNLELAREQVTNVLKSTGKFPDLHPTEPIDSHTHPHAAAGEEESATETPNPLPGKSPDRGRKPRALEVFARELTAPELLQKLDPVIGREQELDRVIEILCRRTKNNPILLGEPGVGKTAIAEGLAQRIAQGAVPDALQNKRLFAIDLALIVAGTMYRGEFEARLKQLLEEVKQDANAILFIDEIHTIVGAGSTSGSLDAANILKPALARGEIRCIGATTWAEYKKHIEPDAALERRYQPVSVEEPSAELTRRMLDGICGAYESHHGVKFTKEALSCAVAYAERYLTDRHFPDKAIDLLDEAAAHVASKRSSRELTERTRSLDVALSAIREEKERLVAEDKLIEAAKRMKDEQRLLKEKASLEKKGKRDREAQRLTVEADHIAAVVARHAHIPLTQLLQSDRAQLNGLATRLAKQVHGQPEAVRVAAEAVRRARLGLGDPMRPKTSLLFVGPSGVGKTHLARLLAQELFGREDKLVKLDMSEFSEGHSVSKLLGSPAGYVGFREGNRLADTLRKHPHAVVLFDEFEKAHQDVQHLLLQALEDGHLTDATGKRISLRHAYIVLTSNIGADLIHQGSIGFGDGTTHGAYTDRVREEVARRLRPELLNRLDAVVVFEPLAKDAQRAILAREVDTLLERVRTQTTVGFQVAEDVHDWMLARLTSSEEGARGIRRLVDLHLAKLLTDALITAPEKKKWKLQIKKNALALS